MVFMMKSAGFFIAMTFGSDIHLTADNRLDPGRPRFLVKLDRAKKISVIGDGQGRHPERNSLLKESIDRVRAVQQTILGVTMEMDEVGMLHGFVSTEVNFQSIVPLCLGKSQSSQNVDWGAWVR